MLCDHGSPFWCEEKEYVLVLPTRQQLLCQCCEGSASIFNSGSFEFEFAASVNPLAKTKASVVSIPINDSCRRQRKTAVFPWTATGPQLYTNRLMEEDLMKRFCIVFAFFAVFALIGSASAGTLDDVKAKGFVQVGVNGDLFGFGKPDEKGVWKGLDVDTGRAIAVLYSAMPDKIKFAPDGQNPLYRPAVR
jgi:hypothetical protein